MPSETQLIFTDNPGSFPASYRLPPGLEVVLSTVYARYDGSGASGDFVPTLDAVSQSGQLMARVAMGQTIPQGSSARTTWAPDLQSRGIAVSSVYHLISAASTNAGVVKAAAGLVTGYYIVNIATGFRYVKLYNKATSPSVGSDTPLMVLGIPPASAANVSLDSPASFGTGIAIATVTGLADSDSTGVGATEVGVTLLYE
ncbi:MAG TPA: hypothetical protein VNC18_17545 [Gemmatimonadaceae bacterium]|nr:hypothetical protein [Gemmatimonadaceae bacterium]